MARRRSSTSWSRRSCAGCSIEWTREVPGAHAGGRIWAAGRRQRRAALPRGRGAPLALPPGAHPGQEDGQGDDLVAGAGRLHARQLDPDPSRPLRLRKVRQARRGLQRRLAGVADPQDPAHHGQAQPRPVRRRQPRPGHCRLGHLRRPRLPRGGDLRHRLRKDRQARGRHTHRTPLRGARARRRGRGGRGWCAGRPHRGGAEGCRRPGGGGRADHLQLLGGASAGASGGDRAHLQPRGRPALRALLLPDLRGQPVLDMASAREAFEASDDFTVGLEEEFAILDPGTRSLVQRFEELSQAAQADEPLAASISGELIGSEIEIRSGRGEGFADALARQRDGRSRLFRLAADSGALLGSTGTHPWSPWQEQRIIDTEHYRRLEDELRYVAWRNNTFSLHVHVGVRGPDRAIRVCDRLRPVLPTLLAISANSPFVDRIDSGLHTARSQIFTKSFPRCGIPDAFGTWAAWHDYVDLLVRTGSIVEFTQLWWSVRPHHDFGTVEVRICDAQMTSTEADGLGELIVACVRRAAAEVDAGETPPDLPARLIEENMWRAIRYGLDGRMLDLEAERIEEFDAG